MENSSLINLPSRVQYFEQGVLANLQYWQTWLDDKITDVTALDRNRNGVIRAVLFGLDLGEVAWSSVNKVIVAFSPYIERRGYWEMWNQILNRAIKLARQIEDISGIANLSGILARLLYRQSRLSESMAAYRQAILLSHQIGNQLGEARACSNLGYFYAEQGRWYRAEVLCCHALEIFEQVAHKHGLAHTENHLGILYLWQNLWDKAQYHLERACQIWQMMEDNHGLMYGYMNLGLLYVKSSRADEALFYSKKALDQAQLVGEELDTAKIYMNIGLAYLSKGDLVQAESYNRQAETIFQPFSNLQGMADVHENWGLIYTKQQKWSEALWHLESALDIWRTLNNKHDEIQCLIHLGHCELAQGNLHQANLWLNEAEAQLRQRSQARRYYQLPRQIDEFRRSLIEYTPQQTAAKKS